MDITVKDRTIVDLLCSLHRFLKDYGKADRMTFSRSLCVFLMYTCISKGILIGQGLIKP